MPDVRTGYGCPTCEKTTGDINEIIARDGRGFVCSKVPAHSWEDPTALYSLDPKIRFQQERPKPAPQQNHTNVNVSISVPAYNALLARYGDRMAAMLTSICSVMAEGEPLIISEEDVADLGSVLAEKPKNARHLRGLIFAMQQTVLEARQLAETAAETTKAYEGMNPGKVVVDFGANYQYALDRAKSDGLPLKVWTDQKVKEACDNTWW